MRAAEELAGKLRAGAPPELKALPEGLPALQFFPVSSFEE